MKDSIVVVSNRNVALAAARLGAQVELVNENTPIDLNAAEESFSRAGIVLLPFELPAAALETALNLAGYHAARVILIASPDRKLEDTLLRRVDYLIASETSLVTLSGTKDIEDGVHRLQRQIGCSLVVILGDNGVLLAKGTKSLRIAPYRPEKIDPAIGSQGFSAAFAAALSEGLSPEQACRWGSAALVLVSSRRDDLWAFPTRAELEALIG